MVKRRRFVTWAAAKCGPASGMEDTVFCTELATQAAATFVPLGRELRLLAGPRAGHAQLMEPPANGRQHRVELLLCGHHYRVSDQALATAGATVQDFPGRAGAAEAALLGGAQQPRVNVS